MVLYHTLVICNCLSSIASLQVFMCSFSLVMCSCHSCECVCCASSTRWRRRYCCYHCHCHGIVKKKKQEVRGSELTHAIHTHIHTHTQICTYTCITTARIGYVTPIQGVSQQ